MGVNMEKLKQQYIIFGSQNVSLLKKKKKLKLKGDWKKNSIFKKSLNKYMVVFFI
jgi:hypothetical protein